MRDDDPQELSISTLNNSPGNIDASYACLYHHISLPQLYRSDVVRTRALASPNSKRPCIKADL